MSTPNPNTPQPIRAGVTDDEIRAYLGLNPNRSDAEIASDMDRYGVTIADMARATGGDETSIRNRYYTAKSTMQPSVPVEVAPTHPPIESSVSEGVPPTHPPIERPPGFDYMDNAMKKYAVDTELAATERAAQAEKPRKEFALSQKAPSKRLTTADGLDFQPMSAASPVTTLSARGGTRLMKKGGAAKKMTKSKW